MFYCISCKICWPKPWSACVKVVEGQLIYNFAVDRLVYLCWRILRKQWSNSASPIDLRSLASRTRCRAGVAHRRVATMLGPHAEAGFRPLVHAPPLPLPNRHPSPIHVCHASTHAAPTTQPWRRRTRTAPPLRGYWPSRLATASPCPCRGRMWPPTQVTRAYKRVRLAPARVAPGIEPPLPPPAADAELLPSAACTANACCFGLP
jgi:hypothetical protein